MILDDRVEAFIERLKLNENAGYKIIKAYPNANKPTLLNDVIVAVSIGEIEARSIELGGECMHGSYKINATIYFPYGNSSFEEIVRAVIDSQLCGYPNSISVSEISPIDNLNCNSIKCSFTFYDDISLGGN